MFKTGIYELKQLINLKGFFDKKKYISASLYPIVHSSNLENKESLEEKILMHFATSKSSYKRTHKERFDEFDAEAIQQAKKHLSEKITISVHDMAASDARTSVDFFKKLEKEFPGKINFLASDKDPYVYECASEKKPGNKIISNEAGEILQIIMPPFVFNMQIKENLFLYPLNRLIELFLSSSYLRKKLLKIENEQKREKITLFSSKAQETASEKTNFHLDVSDILKTTGNKNELVRVMNVFSETNFNEKNRKIIAENLKNSLSSPGLLIIGSNGYSGSPVNGSIFLNKAGRLEEVFKSGDGVCFKELFIS